MTFQALMILKYTKLRLLFHQIAALAVLFSMDLATHTQLLPVISHSELPEQEERKRVARSYPVARETLCRLGQAERESLKFPRQNL